MKTIENKTQIEIKRVPAFETLTSEHINGARRDHASIMSVTPEMAQEVLNTRNTTPSDLPEHQASNRPLRDKKNKKVDLLIKDMKQENWFPTTVIFSRDGKLRDGQHRFSAIAQSKATVNLLVHVGADPDIMGKLDRGKPRSIKEVLGLNLFQKPEWKLKASYWAKAEKIVSRGMSYLSVKKKTKSDICNFFATDSEVFDYANKKRDAVKWAASLSGSKKPKGFGRVSFRVALAEMYHKNPEKALLLLHALVSKTKKSCPSNAIVDVMGECSKESDLDHREFFIDQIQRLFYCMDRFMKGQGINTNIERKVNL
jgi:hypothetical protein